MLLEEPEEPAATTTATTAAANATPTPLPTPTPPLAPTTSDWCDVSFTMPGKIWLDTLEKMVAARVLLPRSVGMAA